MSEPENPPNSSARKAFTGVLSQVAGSFSRFMTLKPRENEAKNSEKTHPVREQQPESAVFAEQHTEKTRSVEAMTETTPTVDPLETLLVRAEQERSQLKERFQGLINARERRRSRLPDFDNPPEIKCLRKEEAVSQGELELNSEVDLPRETEIKSADSIEFEAYQVTDFFEEDRGLTESVDKKYVLASELEEKMRTVQLVLDSFRIDAQVFKYISGPRVSRLDIRPAQGVNVDSIANLSRNFAMELEVPSIRILAPVPGEQYVGIEIPNTESEPVNFSQLLQTKTWRESEAQLPLVLGKDTAGEPFIFDLAQAPHLLIAGATGSGKSVCINTLVCSLLSKYSPRDLRMMMVDPKVVELTCYADIPHLISPVITDNQKVVSLLKWVIWEMEYRYRLLSRAGVRNLLSYNNHSALAELTDEKGEPLPLHLPYIVVIIDELADIMMTARAEVEVQLARIAQLSRAVGIHTIIATQRPSVNVITGIIKANYPSRIGFQVTSHIDSRTILDAKGAEQLLGQGDMLFSNPRSPKLHRIQGAYMDDAEIDRICSWHCSQAEQEFLFNPDAQQSLPFSDDTTGENSGDSELLSDALEIIRRDRKASTSYLQRRLRIGYNRAATLMEELEEKGYIGPQIGSSAREIYVE